MVENDQREALTDGDRAGAFQQLAFEGLSIAAIAKRTGTKQNVVKSGLVVAENVVAATAIQTHQLTLDQAATLIEFEDDEETCAGVDADDGVCLVGVGGADSDPSRRLFAPWWQLIAALRVVPRVLVWDGDGTIWVVTRSHRQVQTRPDAGIGGD